MNKYRREMPDAIRGLTLERLSIYLEAYRRGELAGFASAADAMEERDDILKNVILKRKKALGRHDWEVLMVDGSEEARRHQQALEYFYRNLKCTHGLKEDQRGGFNLLTFQMMDAWSKGWAVHEITWKPRIIKRRSSDYPVSGLPGEDGGHGEEQGGGTRVSLLTSAATSEREGGGGRVSLLTSAATSEREGGGVISNRAAVIREGGGGKVSLLTSAATSEREGGGVISNGSAVIREGGGGKVSLLTSAATKKGQKNRREGLATEIRLTAELKFIPLWCFENKTGKLRFLANRYDVDGQAMREREWLVTTAEPLMVPCARAFLFKHYPLLSWLDYCQKYGLPGLHAVTSAVRDSEDWNELEKALDQFMKDLLVVTNSSESIEVMDLKGKGEEPFSRLVERMDRVMAALWRGADLSTLSRDKGYGASLQEAESHLLEQDDAASISETLNNTLDLWVLQYLFGEEVEPKAYLKILVKSEATPHDLAVDEFLVGHGAELSLQDALERYGRAAAKEGEKKLKRLVISDQRSVSGGVISDQ